MERQQLTATGMIDQQEDFFAFFCAAEKRRKELFKLIYYKMRRYRGRRYTGTDTDSFYQSALRRGFEKAGNGFAQLEEERAASLVWSALVAAVERKAWAAFRARGDAADPGRRTPVADDWLNELQDRRVTNDELARLMSYRSEILDALPDDLAMIAEQLFMGASRREIEDSTGLSPTEFDAAYVRLERHVKQLGLTGD